MPKLNPWDPALARPERRETTLTFAEPEWTLRLRELDEIDLCACRVKIDEYRALYLDGPDGGEPLTLVLPTGRAVKASWPLLSNLAAAECMQVAESEADRYGLMDFLGVAVNLPKHWGKIKRTISDLWPNEDDAGNP